MKFIPKNAQKIVDLMYWALKRHNLTLEMEATEVGLPNPEFRPANCVNPNKASHGSARMHGFQILSIELSYYYIDLLVNRELLKAGGANLVSLIEDDEDKYNVLMWINQKIQELGSQRIYSCINFREKGSGDSFQPFNRPYPFNQWQRGIQNKAEESGGCRYARFNQEAMMQIKTELAQGGARWKYRYYESEPLTPWATIEAAVENWRNPQEPEKKTEERKEAEEAAGNEASPAPVPW